MTTIAYRDGIMAADSKMSAGDSFVTKCDKLFRLSHGAIAGFSGDADERDIRAMLDKVATESDLPSRLALQELQQTFSVLLVLRDGHVYHVECVMEDMSEVRFFAQIVETKRRYAAAGNGHQFAIGAMADGASAERAVEIACENDLFTGGPVHTLLLKEPKPKQVVRPRPKKMLKPSLAVAL